MKFKIDTKKSKNEVIKILCKNTTESKKIPFVYHDEFFIGKITDDSFKIYRNIKYKNSFLPVIVGKLEEKNDGCTIIVKMRLQIFISIFLAIWFSGIIASCLITLSVNFKMPYVLFPFALLLFGCLISILPFKYESKIAKQKLIELFC